MHCEFFPQILLAASTNINKISRRHEVMREEKGKGESFSRLKCHFIQITTLDVFIFSYFYRASLSLEGGDLLMQPICWTEIEFFRMLPFLLFTELSAFLPALARLPNSQTYHYVLLNSCSKFMFVLPKLFRRERYLCIRWRIYRARDEKKNSNFSAYWFYLLVIPWYCLFAKWIYVNILLRGGNVEGKLERSNNIMLLKALLRIWSWKLNLEANRTVQYLRRADSVLHALSEKSI